MMTMNAFDNHSHDSRDDDDDDADTIGTKWRCSTSSKQQQLLRVLLSAVSTINMTVTIPKSEI
jgi:hypothetical protein